MYVPADSAGVEHLGWRFEHGGLLVLEGFVHVQDPLLDQLPHLLHPALFGLKIVCLENTVKHQDML